MIAGYGVAAFDRHPIRRRWRAFKVRDSTDGQPALLRERSQPTPATPKPIQPTVGVTAFSQLATMRTVPANQSTQQNLSIVSFAISLKSMCPPPLRRQHGNYLCNGLGHARQHPAPAGAGQELAILLLVPARGPGEGGDPRRPYRPDISPTGAHGFQ
jgi:hypothetical protein